MEPELLTEVPLALKRLVRYVLRGFYSIDHALVVDLMIHHPCIREDDLTELLKLDRKHVRQLLNTLKVDKFLKTRMRVETDEEGRTTRHNYYFINYMTFVNVVKYKLDHMRRKIETEERDSTSRASFKCPECQKTFTDLEADRLLDFVTGRMQCDFCKSEVEMENTASAGPNARTLMVKFNEQIEPIFALLRELDDVKLAPELLEPEPTDLKLGKLTSSTRSSDRTTWSGSASRNKDYFGYTENQVTVQMTADDAQTKEAKPQKERPVWMVESTVDGAITEPTALANDRASELSLAASASNTSLLDNDDIMRTLLAHEKKSSGPVVPGVPTAPSGGETSSSESEDEAVKVLPPSAPAAAAEVEEMESDEDDDEAMVAVAGERFPYHEVTPDMVNRMTPSEKEEYIRVGQEMYSNMYD